MKLRKMRGAWLAICWLSSMTMNAQTRVVSENDGHAVVFAHVFGQDGAFLGLTDENGNLPEEALDAGRVVLMQPAYQTLETHVKKDKILKMKPVKLPTVAAEPEHGAKDWLCLRVYYRNYVVTQDGLVGFEYGEKDLFYSPKGKLTESEVWTCRRELPQVSEGEKSPGLLLAGAHAVDEESSYEKLCGLSAEERQGLEAQKAAFVYDSPDGMTQMQIDLNAMLNGKSLPLVFTGLSIKKLNVTETFATRPAYSLWNSIARQMYVGMDYKNKSQNERRMAHQFAEVFVTSRSYMTKQEKNTRIRETEKTTVGTPTVPQGISPLPSCLASRLPRLTKEKSY